MTRILRKLLVVGLVLVVATLCTSIPIEAASPKIVIDSVEVSRTGHAEVIGHISTGNVGAWVTFLSVLEPIKEDSSNATMDNIIYIDQVTSGNNGTFLVRFYIDRKFSEKDAMFMMNTNLGTELLTYDYEIPTLPPGIEIIANNSVLYGRDAYYIPGALYEPGRIASSLAFGGNNVFFKLGDRWYDLMDDAAKDNSYLVAENAVSESEVVALKPRYYYDLVSCVELKYYP